MFAKIAASSFSFSVSLTSSWRTSSSSTSRLSLMMFHASVCAVSTRPSTSSSMTSAVRSEYLCGARPSKSALWSSVSAHLMAPSFEEKPYSTTMVRAIFVAFSMSFDAPVVGSWNTTSSAVRPPIAYAIWSSSSLGDCE